MLGTMYAFYILLRIQNERKVSVIQIVLLSVLLICIYFARGGVTELLLIYAVLYFLEKLIRKKKYVAALVLFASAVVACLIFRNAIFDAFATKIDNYGGYEYENAVGLNAIRITGVLDIYKLPLTYAFCMLQPLVLELFTIPADTRPWQVVMSYANMTIYPVAIGAWLYMFVKKHNLFFWLTSFAMFAGVIMLSLGVSRHYLFLFPLHVINYSLYMEDTHENHKNRRTLVLLGTFALFVLVFCYSLVKLF